MNGLLDPPPEDRSPVAAPAHTGADAYADFYRREVGDLVNFLVWMGAGLVDATDLAQETMVDAYRGWSGIKHPRAWARRVASRKFGRRVCAAESAAELDADSPLLPVHHDTAEWEFQDEVIQLLRTLPWRQRQVMAWTLDGYRPIEIAEELQISPDAVRANLRLARLALAAHIRPPGEKPQ
jgi:RNA polymerase sigma-70 factor (ECF subfamily)